jgi:hypothetical protein
MSLELQSCIEWKGGKKQKKGKKRGPFGCKVQGALPDHLYLLLTNFGQVINVEAELWPNNMGLKNEVLLGCLKEHIWNLGNILGT